MVAEEVLSNETDLSACRAPGQDRTGQAERQGNVIFRRTKESFLSIPISQSAATLRSTRSKVCVVFQKLLKLRKKADYVKESLAVLNFSL